MTTHFLTRFDYNKEHEFYSDDGFWDMLDEIYVLFVYFDYS